MAKTRSIKMNSPHSRYIFFSDTLNKWSGWKLPPAGYTTARVLSASTYTNGTPPLVIYGSHNETSHHPSANCAFREWKCLSKNGKEVLAGDSWGEVWERDTQQLSRWFIETFFSELKCAQWGRAWGWSISDFSPEVYLVSRTSHRRTTEHVISTASLT